MDLSLVLRYSPETDIFEQNNEACAKLFKALMLPANTLIRVGRRRSTRLQTF